MLLKGFHSYDRRMPALGLQPNIIFLLAALTFFCSASASFYSVTAAMCQIVKRRLFLYTSTNSPGTFVSFLHWPAKDTCDGQEHVYLFPDNCSIHHTKATQHCLPEPYQQQPCRESMSPLYDNRLKPMWQQQVETRYGNNAAIAKLVVPLLKTTTIYDSDRSAPQSV